MVWSRLTRTQEHQGAISLRHDVDELSRPNDISKRQMKNTGRQGEMGEKQWRNTLWKLTLYRCEVHPNTTAKRRRS